MTLLTAIWTDEYIIMAADTMTTDSDNVKGKCVSSYNEKKIFVGNNFLVAVHGEYRFNEDQLLLEEIDRFTQNSNELTVTTFTDEISNHLKLLAGKTPTGLIIAGFENGLPICKFIDCNVYEIINDYPKGKIKGYISGYVGEYFRLNPRFDEDRPRYKEKLILKLFHEYMPENKNGNHLLLQKDEIILRLIQFYERIFECGELQDIGGRINYIAIDKNNEIINEAW